MERTLRIVRCGGAAGFIAARWLLGVCNLPGLCVWLAVASTSFAAVYAAAFLNPPAGFGVLVLGRRAARLLALTCALNLAAAGLDAIAPERFAWRSGLVDVLDLLAWAWALYAVLAVARWWWDCGPGVPAGAVRPILRRHAVVSAFIVCVLVVQVSAV